MTLAQLNQREEACATLSEVPLRYRTRRRPCSAAPRSRASAPAAIKLVDAAAAARAIGARLDALVGSERRLAIAVSGGGDSMALLAVAADWAAAAGATLTVFTVDHGLRPDSAAEAEMVARAAAARGASHETLRWNGAASAGNLQAAARSARYALMADRRRALGLGPLATAHTRDDVAETFLMRLARGSGVDGLAAMAETVVEDASASPPLRIIRPCLGADRVALRRICVDRGLAWADDPSNVDPRFDRARARAALTALEPLGLGVERLAKTAETMARARAALEDATDALLARAVAADAPRGVATLDAAALRAAPREIGLRAFARALEWASGAAYPPRLAALEAAFDALDAADARGRTLAGCVLARSTEGWRIGREPAAAAAPVALRPGVEVVWDGRFRARAAREGFIVGARAAGPAGGGGGSLLDAGAPAAWWAGAEAGAEPVAGTGAEFATVDEVALAPLRARPASRRGGGSEIS